MPTSSPEIRIQFSRLIYNHISKPLADYRNPGYELPGIEKITEKVADYQKAWEPKGAQIIRGIAQTFGLKFYKSVLDVYIAPRVPTFSTPTIISTRYEPDRFIDVLAHELLHVLISDNDSYTFEKYSKARENLFPGKDQLVQNHIIVHAGLESLFRDTLKEPYRLMRDKEACQKLPAYAEAWKIVEDEGYQIIIRNFRSTLEL